MKKRKTLLAGAVAAACAAATLVTAAPAQAKVMAWEFCKPGMVCLWEHDYGTGAMKGWGEGDREMLYVGNDINDKTSSLWNRTSRTICFYTEHNLDGIGIAVGSGQWVDRLSRSNINDMINSWASYC
ncbi:hypothetical protein C1I98_37805 [Spongiactinospora gelatinilytica]|uniref:Peptidase inhibitor family I36 n=1 Tax=Spongiactinospora gelatinilytica TaxID=2666298 RepID=A0A2W2FDT1_9ACTN|nr:peptidase inhibitor family I36 protein [Spongiactinospora gelatinilytica]PZG19827.1 hypothetical protein C1I98_37805 [Spongiactinospora gelatinilytica]